MCRCQLKRLHQRLKVGCRRPDCLSPFPDERVIIARCRVRFLKEFCCRMPALFQPAHRSMHRQSSMSAGDLKTIRLAACSNKPGMAFGKNNRHLAYVGTYKHRPFGHHDAWIKLISRWLISSASGRISPRPTTDWFVTITIL